MLYDVIVVKIDKVSQREALKCMQVINCKYSNNILSKESGCIKEFFQRPVTIYNILLIYTRIAFKGAVPDHDGFVQLWLSRSHTTVTDADCRTELFYRSKATIFHVISFCSVGFMVFFYHLL